VKETEAKDNFMESRKWGRRGASKQKNGEGPKTGNTNTRKEKIQNSQSKGTSNTTENVKDPGNNPRWSYYGTANKRRKREKSYGRGKSGLS